MKTVKDKLKKRFDMSDLGRLRHFLGIEVIWKQDGTCYLSQRQYIRNVLLRNKMQDCKGPGTPVASGQKLSKLLCPKNDKEKEEMKNVPYRNAVGALIYLVTGTRPDISVAVGEVSKFLENPGQQHWIAVKRIMRYLKHTEDWGLHYGNQNNILRGYCDADWGGDLDNRRSTTGYVFFLGKSLVCWKSKRQPTVARSTSEAEYMSLASGSANAVWLRCVLEELGFSQTKATIIFEDNQGCKAIAEGSSDHERTKHIDIRYHATRELVENKTIEIIYCPTQDMIADILTKSLTLERHIRLCQMMNLDKVCIEEEC
jgi:hypothetical protein